MKIIVIQNTSSIQLVNRLAICWYAESTNDLSVTSCLHSQDFNMLCNHHTITFSIDVTRSINNSRKIPWTTLSIFQVCTKLISNFDRLSECHDTMSSFVEHGWQLTRKLTTTILLPNVMMPRSELPTESAKHALSFRTAGGSHSSSKVGQRMWEVLEECPVSVLEGNKPGK